MKTGAASLAGNARGAGDRGNAALSSPTLDASTTFKRTGWQGRGDPMEETVERWLTENGINYRRADAMKTHLDFFLPDFNVYIECKRFHTPRIDDQLSRSTDIIIIQGTASLKFLDSLVSRKRESRAVETERARGGVG